MVCERKKPLTRPATAGESAVAGHPLPKGEGYISDLGTRGVQPKMWDTLSPLGGEGPGGEGVNALKPQDSN
jgi:hypothetical protein